MGPHLCRVYSSGCESLADKQQGVRHFSRFSRSGPSNRRHPRGKTRDNRKWPYFYRADRPFPHHTFPVQSSPTNHRRVAQGVDLVGSANTNGCPILRALCEGWESEMLP